VHGLAPQLQLAVLVLAAASSAWLALGLRRALHRRRLRRRCRHAAEGQARARGLLEERGFVVEAEEVVVPGELVVDGERCTFEVRIDFLARRGRRLYGVEVKTGRQAADPACRATRRQLAEYARVLPVDGLFLLDIDRRRLSEVRFPEHARGSRSAALFFAFLLGAAAALLLVRTLGLPR